MSKNKQTIRLGDANLSVDVVGKFSFKVQRDPKKFRLTNINAFVPRGKGPEDMLKFINSQGETDSLLIEKIQYVLDPDNNVQDRHNVSVLIQHPDVKIDGIPEEEWAKLVKAGLKKSNPKFIIKSLEKAETVDYDYEADLIEAKYKLFSKDKPISTDLIMHICGVLGIPYRLQDIESEDKRRKELIKRLSNHISVKSKPGIASNLDKFNSALKNVQNTEVLFYINELISLELIKDFGGIYKVGDRPVGSTKEDIVNYYASNKDIYLEHKKLVIQSMKRDNVLA